MTRSLRSRLLAPIGLSLVMGLTAAPALAQNDPAAAPGAEGEGESGRPLDGYLATAAIAGLILFIVAKSARRS